MLGVLQFECCGVTGPRDYFYSAWFNASSDTAGAFVPTTCCRLLAADVNLCQVEAVLHAHVNASQDRTQLHTQVGLGCNFDVT